MQTKSDIAARIKEGARKRSEDQRRRQQLQREFLADVRGQSSEDKQQGPSRYIACIFVTLLFLSFPLSEQVVDWTLVGLFCGLNAFWVLVLRDPSDWLNILTMILSNLLLARWSSHIYDIPAQLAAAPPGLLVGYVTANVVTACVTYYCYVEHNWFRSPSARRSSSRARRAAERVGEEDLELYLLCREKRERTDWAICTLVVCNVVALVATGIIPTEVVTRVAQGWMLLLQ